MGLFTNKAPGDLLRSFCLVAGAHAGLCEHQTRSRLPFPVPRTGAAAVPSALQALIETFDDAPSVTENPMVKKKNLGLGQVRLYRGLISS